MRTLVLTAILQKDDDCWTSHCPELDVASQGDSIEQAKSNLREAVELLLEATPPDEIEQRMQLETFFSQLVVEVG